MCVYVCVCVGEQGGIEETRAPNPKVHMLDVN